MPAREVAAELTRTCESVRRGLAAVPSRDEFIARHCAASA